MLSGSNCILSNDKMINELERICSNLRYYPGIFLEGLREITENLSQDSRSPGQDFNLGPPGYKAKLLTTQLLHLVLTC
jgi:hypothetical protein